MSGTDGCAHRTPGRKEKKIRKEKKRTENERENLKEFSSYLPPPRVYVRTHFDVYMSGTFLKIFRTYTHIGEMPRQRAGPKARNGFLPLYTVVYYGMCICPKTCVYVRASTNTDICTGHIHGGGVGMQSINLIVYGEGSTKNGPIFLWCVFCKT